MKRSLLIPALSLLVVVTACTADGDCEGNYWIGDSSDMDEAALCESISGDLTFEGQTWLTSIDLPRLTTVGGYLNIYNNPALTNLDGLSSLTSVGLDLNIWNNDVLTNLDGLSNLTTVGGGLGIVYNAVLTDISGLSNLTSVWDLYINDNPALCQSLVDAFVAACTIGGSVTITGNDDGC
jgi:hypothetical protein